MATANPPPKTAVTEWCKVFHTLGTENYTSSLTFTKQLTVVALSIITYMKNVFPENCYTVETFAGLKLKILKSKCNDELAQFVSTSLTQAFEALEKKYLHQLALCFYEDECKLGNLLEYHIFKYTYNPGGVDLNIHSKNRGSGKRSVKCSFQDVNDQTTQLIRACLVMMQACQQELPPTADVSLRLYYNDDAPEDYQAPGYLSDDAKDPLEHTLNEVCQLGWVETPYHKIVAKSYMRDIYKESSREAIPSPNTPMMTASTQQVDFNVSVHRSDSGSSTGLQLRCPCNKYDDIANYNAPLMITCLYCNTLQHAACFGLLADRVSRLRTHCCAECADRDPQRVPTDPRLGPLSARKRECLCIFRRTLEWCSQLDSIDGARLVDRFNISTVNAAKLLKLLDSYGVVRLESNADIITPTTIYPEQLQAQLGKYFQSDEETSLADRLLAETFASQESNTTDPVGEVLSPMEKIALQNTSTLGRVIENPDLKKQPDADDTTMRQYREAILSGEQPCEEMPLAGSCVVENMLKGAQSRGKRKLDAPEEKGAKKPRAGVRSKRVTRAKK